MEGYVSRIQAHVRVSRLHDGSIHHRRCVFYTARARVHRGASFLAYIVFYPAPALDGLAMARCQAKELAHGSGRRRFDRGVPVRRHSSLPAVESELIALAPGTIWHRNV